MHITLTPMRRDASLQLERAGDLLVINGEAFDFSALPEGATLPMEAIDSDWLGNDVWRENGRLHLTLIVPHGPRAGEQARAQNVIINPADGPIPLTPTKDI